MAFGLGPIGIFYSDWSTTWALLAGWHCLHILLLWFCGEGPLWALSPKLVRGILATNRKLQSAVFCLLANESEQVSWQRLGLEFYRLCFVTWVVPGRLSSCTI